jgi:hypothetical protein
MMRATVIVDVSSLAHQLGDLDGFARRANVRVASLLHVLADRGYEVDHVMAAVGTIAVITGHDSDIDTAEAICAANRKWLELEADALPDNVKMTVLHGGHDGTREIGVDDLVVAAALVEAHRIKDSGEIDDRLVLIVTHDGDMDHVASYASPVTVRMVGSYDSLTRKRLRRSRVPFDALHDYELRNCGLVQPWRIPVGEDDASRKYQLSPDPVEELPETTHVAVIDAYGLACSAACALGISRLPNVGSLRTLLMSIGYPSDTALLVTIPDIAHARPTDDALIHARNLAWYARDKELDDLSWALQNDGDETTQVRRGLLRPDQLPDDLRQRLDRSGPTRAAKRVATQLTADMVRCALRGDANEVILLTDSPHVVWVQAYLSQLRTELPVGNVVRVGVYAAPVTLIDSNGDTQLLDVQFRMLTEDAIAQMTRTHSYVGRALRQRMHDTLGSAELDTIRWKVIGFDPEIDGVRVRRVDDPAFDMLLADAVTLGVVPGQEITLGELDIELHFQPGMPTLVPVPACRSIDRRSATRTSEESEGDGATPRHVAQTGRRSNRPGSVRTYADVVVVEREGTHLHFDIDGDEIPDGSVPLGHDMRPLVNGAPAILGKLHKASDEWYFVSAHDDSPTGKPELIEVTAITESTPTARGIKDPSGTQGPLYSPPNCPVVPVAVSDRLWAINTAPDADHPNWITLSTPIESFLPGV